MKVIIIGAGMSGLSAALMLKRKGVDIELFESASYIGGFAHSFSWNGHTCDWAAHRLFTHDDHVLQQLLSLVPMNRLEKVSAVHLGGKWLKDPVDAVQLCTRFFPGKTLSIPWGYLTRPRHLPETSFRNYCVGRFGRTLDHFLFSPYTEKMFGIPAEQISVEWARKKVRLAGPLDVIRQGSKKKFSYFYYPKQGGYGSIPNRMYDEVKEFVHLNAALTGLQRKDGRITAVEVEQNGQRRTVAGDLVISTIPLTELCGMLGHQTALSYRAVSAVYALVKKPQTTPNHWIYYMDGDVAVNRLCEVKNMDPHIGPEETSVVCAEVTDRDRPDFVEKTIRDLAASGIFTMDQVLDTTVVTREYSYPVYFCDYEKEVDKARVFLAGFSNLRYIGRAAQYEHMEVDDCFSAAQQLVHEITAPPAADVAEPRRSALPVEPQVAAVVAALGTDEETLDCVGALAQSDYRQTSIVVIADPERKNLRQTLQQRHPAAHWLDKTPGMGIPAAFNLGCNHAIRQGADFVFCALGQTRAENDLLSQLVAVAQRDPEAGILTPKILRASQPGRIWSIGLYFRRFPPSTKNIGGGQADDERFSTTREVDFAVSCGLLIKREVFEKIGLFDPGYAFYYEDVDFSQRARAEGFRIRFVPEARLYYHEQDEAPRDEAFFQTWGESFARYYRRHMSPFWLKLPAHLSYLAAREALTGNARGVRPLLKGVLKGIHKRLAPAPKLGADFL